MRILVLEDDQERHKQFKANFSEWLGKPVDLVLVATAKEAIDLLKPRRKWGMLFLDHDLGGKTMVESGLGTGYEVATWLEAHPKKVPKYVVIHSFNPTGSERMAQALKGSVKIPGAWCHKISAVVEAMEKHRAKMELENKAKDVELKKLKLKEV